MAAAAIPQAPRAHTEHPATEPPNNHGGSTPKLMAQADGRQPRPRMSCDNFRDDNKLEHE